MSETKHTPGPWELCSAKNCTCMMIHSIPADQHVATAKQIACVHGEWGDGPEMLYGEVPPEQVQANAHLIAAAPDLLDALEAMILCMGQHFDSEFVMAGDEEAYKNAKAAIAKARR